MARQVENVSSSFKRSVTVKHDYIFFLGISQPDSLEMTIFFFFSDFLIFSYLLLNDSHFFHLWSPMIERPTKHRQRQDNLPEALEDPSLLRCPLLTFPKNYSFNSVTIPYIHHICMSTSCLMKNVLILSRKNGWFEKGL